MRAMILAAGRGERMRPLTDTCPKPLLLAGGRALIDWHLMRLARSGFRDIVVNHAWLGPMIAAHVGDGARFGLSIRHSAETEALETAGGIANALPMLGNEPFLVVNGDIWCDFDFGRARTIAAQMRAGRLDAWCVLVPNPEHHRAGDFGLDAGKLTEAGTARLTFAGIGVYAPALFDGIARGARAPLAPLLRAAIARGAAGGECFTGTWIDVGTPQRLARLDAQLTSNATGD